MSGFYFENEKTGKRYDVIKFDTETGIMTLKGQHAEFSEKFDKEKFKRMGYVMKKVNAAEAA